MIDSDSFSFGFEIQDDDILIIENNNTYVNVSYIPDNYMQFDVTATNLYTISDEGKEL